MGGNDIPPLCECHGEPKIWNKRNGGGYWRCRVKARDSRKRYMQTARGLALRKARQKRYRQGKKGQAYVARNNNRRVIVGTQYFGITATAEEAEAIKQRGRDLLADFKQRQREATDVASS